jgi:uroporphyrinogen-III synthase
LKGFTVAITADRRRDEQAVLLERLGVEVLMFPVLQTQPEDAGRLRALTEKVVQEPPDYLLANTGYGMRTWLGLAAEWDVLDGLVFALRSKTTIAARGAKALGELRKVGLDAWYKAPGETLEEVVGRLAGEELAGRSVLVQLHGEAPGPTLADLELGGASVSYLPVYRMGGGGAQALDRLVETLLDGEADVVTFTAAPQVQALKGAAAARGVLGPVVGGFNEGGVVAACIGPVCAGAARAEGILSPLVPEHSRLGSLATAIGAELARRQAVLAGKSGPVRVCGRMSEGRDGRCWLEGTAERRALRALCTRPGDCVDLSGVVEDPTGALAGLAEFLDGAVEYAGGSARLLVAQTELGGSTRRADAAG